MTENKTLLSDLTNQPDYLTLMTQLNFWFQKYSPPFTSATHWWH